MRRGIVGGWPVRAEFVEQAAVSDETAVTVEERRWRDRRRGLRWSLRRTGSCGRGCWSCSCWFWQG